MIRIQRMKTQCTERDKPARKIFTEVKVETAQYGWEKVGSNKWSVGKERNPTDFKNTHYWEKYQLEHNCIMFFSVPLLSQYPLNVSKKSPHLWGLAEHKKITTSSITFSKILISLKIRRHWQSSKVSHLRIFVTISYFRSIFSTKMH